MAVKLGSAALANRRLWTVPVLAALRSCAPGICISALALLLRRLLTQLALRLLRRRPVEPPTSRVDPIWLTCNLSADQVQRFGRQVVLPKLGVAGQQALLRGRVLVVGAGGLGCPVALYLCAAGVGHLGIADGDTVDVSNLHRQVAHSKARVGENKAISLRRACLAVNETSEVMAFPKHVASISEASQLAAAYDVLIDCTDLPRSRYRMNDAAVAAGKPLIAASSVGLSGQLAVYNYDSGPCLRCVFPDEPGTDAAEPMASCAENGVLGPVPGVLGCLAAVEALKLLAGGGLNASRLSGSMLLYDALDAPQPFRAMRIRKKEGCACCQNGIVAPPGLRDLELQSTGSDCRCNGVKPSGSCPSICPRDLSRRLSDGEDVVLIDVRQRSHFAVSHLTRSENWPLAELRRAPLAELQRRVAGFSVPGKESQPLTVCVCRRGNDSLHATLRLRAADIEAFNLEGGLIAMAAMVKPPLQPPPLT